MFNARAETLTQKPSFRSAYSSRRCLVPADGFFEWQKIGRTRQPYRICLEDRRLFAFAGLWERWVPASGEVSAIETFTIVTTTAHGTIEHIHPRMPVILDEDHYQTWLVGGPEEARNVLRVAVDLDIAAYPVSSRIGDIRNDDPQLLDPVAELQPSLF